MRQGHRAFAAGMESKPSIAPRRQFVPLPQSGILRPDRGLYARAAAQLAQCTVPEIDPGRDAVTRRPHRPFGYMRRVRDQTFQQFPPLGAVTVSIEFDMAVDVADEMTQAVVIVPGIVERPEKSAEHLRDYVATTRRSFLELANGEPSGWAGSGPRPTPPKTATAPSPSAQ